MSPDNPTQVVAKCAAGLVNWDAAVKEVLTYEENVHGEDTVQYKCKLCNARHTSRIHTVR